MISKEQKRSEFALGRIEKVIQGNGKVSEELASFIVGTPTMILQNGFGQTMAYLLSKCKGTFKAHDKHYFTFESISRWCEGENQNVPSNNPLSFLKKISELKQAEYLALQEEALKMLQWLKRYARAFQEE